MTNEGISLIKSFEGCRLEAYQDVVGVWTIGYGHTYGVRAGAKISLREAEDMLVLDLKRFETFVRGLGVSFSDHQVDALVSLAFNIGMNALEKSTLLKRIRQNAPIAEVEAQWKRWVYAGGRVLPGLVARRVAEFDLYCKP